jgi:hypothetical protein
LHSIQNEAADGRRGLQGSVMTVQSAHRPAA